MGSMEPSTMVVACHGGVVTRIRLALARAALWCAWEFAYWSMVLLLNENHPTRVFLKGGRSTMRPIQSDALQNSVGPRTSSRGRWRWAAIGLAIVILAVHDGIAITGLGF